MPDLTRSEAELFLFSYLPPLVNCDSYVPLRTDWLAVLADVSSGLNFRSMLNRLVIKSLFAGILRQRIYSLKLKAFRNVVADELVVDP